MPNESAQQDGAADSGLILRPLRGTHPGEWLAQLDEDIMSLTSPEGRLVLMIPREDAARLVRFQWDVMKGRTVSFVVVAGLKAYNFACPEATLRRLLAWVPTRPEEEIREEVRRYGLALVLLGAALLLFQDYFFAGWGVLFVLFGAGNIRYPWRVLYAANGAVMLILGLVFLFTATRPIGIDPEAMSEAIRVAHIGLGSLLLIWGVEQFSLLGPDYLLRRRLAPADETVDGDTKSGAVLAVAGVLALLAVLFFGQLAFLGYGLSTDAAPAAPVDWLVAGVFAAGLGCGAVALFVRGRRAYAEAKLAGQFAVIVAGLYLAGAIALRNPLAPHVLLSGLGALPRPFVWAPLVVTVVAFSRGYVWAVGREIKAGGE